MVGGGRFSQGNNVFEVGTAKIFLKTRTLNNTFWRYFKQYFGSWNC